MRLSRSFPRRDLLIQAPRTYDRISCQKVRTDWVGQIVSAEAISSNVARQVIQPFDPESRAGLRTPFLPGQYLDIEIPGAGLCGSHSMATTCADPQLEFPIVLLPNGRISEFPSTQARPGLIVKLRGPFGTFNFRENGLRPRYFVAGDTGLSPVASILRLMRRERHPHEANFFWRNSPT